MEGSFIERRSKDADAPLRTMVYRTLRHRLVTGIITPDQILSTRALARELGVSPMPVRDAVARLAAEGALEIKSKSSVVVPRMTPVRFEDLLFCRLRLEPAAASRSLSVISADTIEELHEIDRQMNACLASGDVETYMSCNHKFHFKLYSAQPAPTTMQMIETLWLQFGPMMRVVFERTAGRPPEDDKHPAILKALHVRDADQLCFALRADIQDGMDLLQNSDPELFNSASQFGDRSTY